MKKILFTIAAAIICITFSSAQNAIWHDEGDTALYTNVKVGINTAAPKEALEVNGYVRGNGGNGAFQVKTNHGITAIGADSPGYSHFDTDRGLFYFKKPIVVQGGKISSSHGTNLYLQTLYYTGGSIIPTTRMTILNTNGNVGIGTTSPNYKLDVAGKIHASDSILSSVVKSTWAQISQLQATGVTSSYLATYTIGARSNVLTVTAPMLDCTGKIRANEIIVNSASGADFVFERDYNLRSLDEVNSFIQKHQHLPEIPSAKQMQEDGMSVDQMVVKLLQKVEELTLYTIQQEERIKELEQRQK